VQHPTNTTSQYSVAEPYGNYNRIMLSAVLCGDKTIEDIVINNRQWYEDNHITLHAGEDKAVVRMNAIQKSHCSRRHQRRL